MFSSRIIRSLIQTRNSPCTSSSSSSCVSRSSSRSISSIIGRSIISGHQQLQGFSTDATATTKTTKAAAGGTKKGAEALIEKRVEVLKKEIGEKVKEQRKAYTTPEELDGTDKDPWAKIKPPSPQVQKLIDEVLKLNMLEVAEFVLGMKKALRFPPDLNPVFIAAGGSAMPVNVGGAAPAAGDAGAAAAGSAPGKKPDAAPAQAKTTFDIKLESFDPANKIKVIKEVRGATDLGLKEAKDLVEALPKILKKDVKKEEADELMKKLTAAGAKVSLV